MRLSPSRFVDSSLSFAFSSFSYSHESLSDLKQKNPETIAPATLMTKQTALKTSLNWSGSISVFLPGWCGYPCFNWSRSLRILSSLFCSASSSISGERGRRSPRTVNSLTSMQLS
nr:MAG TPA: hypothetical protein [Caudoviricetes sp.]